jgi:hypothetical protein
MTSTSPIKHVVLIIKENHTFGLPPLNALDAASDDMSDCFDFSQQPAGPPK